jgi:hypothetical protein
MALDQDGLALDNPHFNEAPAQRARPVDAGDSGLLTGLQ